MPAADIRVLPLARLLLSGKGEADPVLIDRGHVDYHVIAEGYKGATYSRDSNGAAHLEYVEDIGLVCRPFVVLQDTRLTNYATSGGSWEDRPPSTGSPRTYRLIQYDTAAGLEWSATSKFDLVANPQVAFTLAMAESAADWNSVTHPQFCRIEFGDDGNSVWGIHFTREGSFLIRDTGTGWQVVNELSGGQAFGADEEKMIYLRVLRAQVGISFDFGRSYTWTPTGDAVSDGVWVPAAPFTLRGRGGAALFGLQQIRYYEGTYTSPERYTYTSRGLLTALTFDPWQSVIFTGDAIDLDDLSTPVDGVIQWKATLTPGSHAGVPFTFYSTPELYAVQAEYPATVDPPSGYFTTPFDGSEGDITEVHITKPYELDQATCDVTVRRDALADFVWNSGRWAKVRVDLGHLNEDGSTAWTVAFTGYVDIPNLETSEYNAVELTLQVESLATRLKRAKWGSFDRPVLGGLTVNAAMDRVLRSEGMFSLDFGGNVIYDLFRLWHVAGNRPTDTGTPEDPFLRPQRGQSKWETMQELARLANVEIGITDAGLLFTIPTDSFNPNITQLWEAEPSAELLALIKRASFRLISSESATAVEVTGKDEQGNERIAMAINFRAEQNRFAPDFCAWRELVVEELSGTCSQGMLNMAAVGIAKQVFPLKFESDQLTPVRLGLSRRDQGLVQGMEGIGIAPYDRFGVLHIEHHYTPSMPESETTAGLLRLN